MFAFSEQEPRFFKFFKVEKLIRYTDTLKQVEW